MLRCHRNNTTTSNYIDVGRRLRAELLEADCPPQLPQMVKLCDELTAEYLYLHYANTKVHIRECDFWACDDRMLRGHVKAMADRRLLKVLQGAQALDIPIHYLKTDRTTVYAGDQLRWCHETAATPVMDFRRHDQGTDYFLHLRLGQRMVEQPCDHGLVVLTFAPGLFVLDGEICTLDESLSAQLLLPFVEKSKVAIPRRMENDYFRRFILKQVSKVEIWTDGFDIDDAGEPLQPQMAVETAINGDRLLTLQMRYGTAAYPPDGREVGRVVLREREDGGFQFIRFRRDTQREQAVVRTVEATGARLSDNGSIAFATTSMMVEWLRRYAPMLREGGVEVVQPSDNAYYIGPLSVEQSESWQGDWLQTQVTIVLDGGRLRIPFAELRDTILRGEQEYMLPTGERLLIPEEWLARYAPLVLAAVTTGKGFMRHRSQLVGKAAEANVRQELPSGEVALPHRLQATLRPYQRVGYEWLWHHLQAGLGCCLSDEMGLGKTIQAIALLLKYKEATKVHKRKPAAGFLFTEEEMSGEAPRPDVECTADLPFRTSLVVAPASVVHNWRNELARFAPTLSTCVYVGNVGERALLRRSLMKWDVVVTTYRTLANDIEMLAGEEWGIAVYDESQAFKNALSRTHEAVVGVRALFHLALSGTPVENNLGELWGLMNVLNPSLLGTLRHFRRSFVHPIARRWEEDRVTLLRQMVKPFFLKRTKWEVLDDLPERQDEVVVCPMTDAQGRQYAEELSRARNEWMAAEGSAAHKEFMMMAALQRLRKIANGEGKMAVVFDHLEQLRGTSHKVLLFSEYVTFLDKVAEEMENRGWTYEMLTGQTTERERVIGRFQTDMQCQFFLISLKAGGLGLNLVEADYVFLLDPWWNLSAEEQAISRSHRIGQRRPVFVYRFVSERTLEEQILTLQQRKQSLIDSVMPFILLPNTTSSSPHSGRRNSRPGRDVSS